MFLKTTQNLPYRLDNHHIIDFIFSLNKDSLLPLIESHTSYNIKQKRACPIRKQALHI
jgi:hypothetical protein